MIPQPSSLHPSHYTDYAVLAPFHINLCYLSINCRFIQETVTKYDDNIGPSGITFNPHTVHYGTLLLPTIYTILSVLNRSHNNKEVLDFNEMQQIKNLASFELQQVCLTNILLHNIFLSLYDTNATSLPIIRHPTDSVLSYLVL